MMNNLDQKLHSQPLVEKEHTFLATYSGVSLRIGETGEYWKVTGGLLWKGKAPSENKQYLKFCVVAEEFSDA